MDFTKCSKCGGEIAGYRDGELRHYGTSIAHREDVCLGLLRAQLAEVTRERDEAIEAIIAASRLIRDGKGYDAHVALLDLAVRGRRNPKEPKP